jgi:tripartite-type tricarboxylate transporter receptor subunit TctC
LAKSRDALALATKDAFRTAERRRRAGAVAAFAVWAAALLSGSVAVDQARAQTANFYRGKTVQVLAGFSPGGGYDAYARALAAFLPEHIPGRPQAVVENMTGAGSLRLAMYLQFAAPADGLTLGTIDNGLQIASLIRPDVVKFNGSRLKWIGSLTPDLMVCGTWRTVPAKKVADLRGVKTAFGATGPDDIRYESIAVLKNVIGANISIVTGYPGTSDIRLSIENGETSGFCDSLQSLEATKPDWLNQKKVVLLVQMASTRSKDLPDVPAITEFARSPAEKDALDLIFSSTEFGRPFGAPPGIPADRLDILRRAFDATASDPKFLQYAHKINLQVDPASGEATQKFLERVYAYPPSVIALARKLIE